MQNTFSELRRLRNYPSLVIWASTVFYVLLAAMLLLWPIHGVTGGENTRDLLRALGLTFSLNDLYAQINTANALFFMVFAGVAGVSAAVLALKLRGRKPYLRKAAIIYNVIFVVGWLALGPKSVLPIFMMIVAIVISALFQFDEKVQVRFQPEVDARTLTPF